MNTQALLALIAAIAYIPLFALLVSNRPWQKQHKLLLSFLTAAMLWSIGTALFRSYFLTEHKLLLGRVVLGILILSGVQLHYFAHHFYNPRGFGFPTAYLLTAVVLVLVLTHVPEDVVISGQTIQPVYGIYAFPSILFFYILLGRDIYLLRRTQHVAIDPQRHNQISYLILGISTLLVFISASLTPIGKDIPVGHFGNLINAGILTYATLRHELVSIKYVGLHGLAYGGAAVLITGFYLFILSLLHYVFGLELNFITIVTAAVISGVFLGGFWYPMQRSIKRLVDQLFYGERLDYRKAALAFSHRAQSILKLDDVGKEMARLVAGMSGARSVYLLLQESRRKDFVSQFAFPEAGSSPPTSLKLSQDSPIVSRLSREGKYLRREELDILPEFASLRQEERKTIDSAGIELFLPLIARDRLVAVLALTRTKSGGSYDIDDLNLLQLFSSQAAVMIDNAQLYTESKELGDDLHLINRLTQIITSSLNINEVYERFIRELRKVMDADWASVVLIEGDQLRLFALTSLASSEWKTGETIPVEETATAYVAKTKKTLVERDLLRHHKFWTGEIHLKAGIRSIVYVPLLSKGEAIGALIIGSFRPNAYEAKQVALLEQLAAQITMAIENSRLYEEIKRQAIRDELTGLFNRRHFEERLNEEIDRHSRYGGTFCLLISDLDLFKNYNDIYGHRAGDKLLWEIAQMAKGSLRSVDLVFRYGGDEFVVLLPQTTAQDAYSVSERLRIQIASEMGAREIGITASLGIACWPTDGVTPDEIIRAADAALYHAKQSGGNQTSLFSEIVSSPVEHAITRVSDEKTALSTAYALVAAVDAKDHYTSRHSQLVATYATALAKVAGLPPEEIAILKTAALLHDVGKIGIPDELLNKTGKLTAEEWETLQSHSTLGVSIISHVPSLAPCLPIILHHHERYNGLGYPKQLKGDMIPLKARILAIADAFAAMISDRPYRPARSYKEAIEELKQGAGVQFDPKLVELFIPIALSLAPEEVTAAKNPAGQPDADG